MTDLAGAVQKALYDALSAVEGMPPVVSEPPVSSSGDQEVVVYPFVLIGDDQIIGAGGKVGQFERHEPAIHVCMQSTTKLAVRAVQELVRATLHDRPIAADGASLSKPKALNQNVATLEDGATQVGTQTFLIFAQGI